jgi:hypothetical protein
MRRSIVKLDLSKHLLSVLVMLRIGENQYHGCILQHSPAPVNTPSKHLSAHSKLSELLDQRVCCRETITTLKSVYNRSLLEFQQLIVFKNLIEPKTKATTRLIIGFLSLGA